MAGRVFYIDPLHGSSGYDGTTSADNISGTVGPFGSLYDVLWGGDADPAKFGGSGDTYYLVGSTTDALPPMTYSGGVFGGARDYNFYSNTSRWGMPTDYIDSSNPPKFIGLNTSLEEDGSLYDLRWQIDAGPNAADGGWYGFATFFTNRGIGAIWRNLKWTCVPSATTVSARLGRMRSYTSGGGGDYFINCTWDWTNPEGLDNTFGIVLWASANPSASFKNCTFLGTSSNNNSCIDASAQYGQHNAVIGCKFRNWNRPVWHNGDGYAIYGNIFDDCNYGVYADTNLSSTNKKPIMNNLFYNINNDGIYFDDPNDNQGSAIIMHNLFVNIGGYAFNCASGWGPADDQYWCFRKNVVQDATSGMLGPDVLASHGGVYVGMTGDVLYGNISENVTITGLTMDIDTDFNVTISGFPSSALGITGTLGLGANSSAAGFLSSGESGGVAGAVVESEQGRVTA